MTANFSFWSQGKLSPISCSNLRIISYFCMIIALVSILFNSFLLCMFSKFKSLRNSINRFVIAITIINLIGTIIEFSFIIPNTYFCKYRLFIQRYFFYVYKLFFSWIFGRTGCCVSAFLMYTTGLLQIYFSVAIAYERLY